MGRGLSELQKGILRIAESASWGIDNADVLERHYKLKPARGLSLDEWREAFKDCFHQGDYRKHAFVEWDEDEGRYKPNPAESERAATSRAFRRLKTRGLMEKAGGAWWLTNRV